MEAVGSVQIFQRSVGVSRYLKYTRYLGDGDSAPFKKVVESKPYGEVEEAVKLECVGHIQKRVGTRCRRLKQDLKGRKLGDGKGIAGTGRLTDKMIENLQNYYGLAIRQHAANLPGMIKAVKSILGHLSTTDQDPNHEFCDASWCGFLKDPNTYRHKNALLKCIIKL
ncbi:phenolphthiocerol synthesis polyketide synthase type i pks15/1 [Plakobranchus ocellatus]|uniref:Phenolphthiocerol synthesis polyketide synthase type i pks15/1 n=1 Tax=Plakobranchus ocellatus TaxID=259542 RepID=A0AAV4B488_9GAST|nr:phenolphthiocerol synthesis polyketide synthase type i pks15/1 [Plakobranchus ocellatus]